MSVLVRKGLTCSRAVFGVNLFTQVCCSLHLVSHSCHGMRSDCARKIKNSKIVDTRAPNRMNKECAEIETHRLELAVGTRLHLAFLYLTARGSML